MKAELLEEKNKVLRNQHRHARGSLDRDNAALLISEQKQKRNAQRASTRRAHNPKLLMKGQHNYGSEI